MQIAPEFFNRVLELRDTTDLSFAGISTVINEEFNTATTKDSVQKLYQNWYRENHGKPKDTTDAIRRWFRDQFDASKVRPFVSPVERRKIVVVSDLHANPDPTLTHMIVDEQPDIIDVGGDLLDSKSISRHPYNSQDGTVTLQEEMFTMRAWLSLLREKCAAYIGVRTGNHDAWAIRNIAELVPHHILFLVQDPLELMISGLPNVEMLKYPVEAHVPTGEITDLGHNAYLGLWGDAIVSHVNFTGKYPGDAARKLYEYVKTYRRYLGWPDIALGIQTHTHKLSLSAYEGGFYYAVEPGVGGTPAIDAYKVNGYESKWSPSPIGAVVFEQQNVDGQWRTIRSSIRHLQPYR